jgi:hypothetical protein
MILESLERLDSPQVDDLWEWISSTELTRAPSRKLFLGLQSLLQGRSMFITNTHHQALGPEKAQVGDVICWAQCIDVRLAKDRRGIVYATGRWPYLP